MISNSPDSYINVFHIHFHFQENISAETVILRTFQAFIGAKTGVRSFFPPQYFEVIWGVPYSSKQEVPCFDLHKTERFTLHLQKIVYNVQ